MEAKYKSLTIFEFQKRFPDADSCLSYLNELKWSKGYTCKRCGHGNYCKGGRAYERQCTSCRYTESPTSGTLFHKVKFSILHAFYIVYYVSTNKKGISSTELSRKLGLRQKTCWLFKQKVMRGMKSSGNFPMVGDVELDEAVVGQQEKGVIGRKNIAKKLVVFAIEKKGKGVSRLYGKVIEKADGKSLGAFMKETISAQANIRTDGWTGYSPTKSNFPNLKQEKSGTKGENFPKMHRVIMGFKGWLRGMHHHAEHLQGYVDEYCYRFNRSNMTDGIFDNLLNRMITAQPFPYKLITV
jgi:hypothetical protein